MTSATWFATPDIPQHPSGTGVLVLSGIGHEEEAVSIGIPAIAGATSDLGLPTLLIDFAGNGQSPDALDQPDAAKVWCAQVVAAIAFLREHGVEKIVIVAPRLASLVAIVATADALVDALVLLSPVFSGRRYLRELRMMQVIGPSDPAAREGSRSVGGFTIPATVVESIARLEAASLETLSAPAILCLESPGRSVDDRTIAKLQELGASVELRTNPDIASWLFAPTDSASIPFESAREVARWIDRTFLKSRSKSTVTVPAPTTSHCYSFAGTEICETFIHVGEQALSGVLAESKATNPNLAAVLYCSMGPGRSFVHEARKAAAKGRLTLRFDFAGFGLSPLHPTQEEPELYGRHGADDIRMGVETLVGRGAKSVIIVGFCAGAWSSIMAAPVPRTVGIAALNVDLSVRLRKIAGRSKNNQEWQRMVGPTIFDRIRRKAELLAASVAPPLDWFNAIERAGVSVGLFFDTNDLGLEYWDNRLAKHFRRQLNGKLIEVHRYDGLGHILEGHGARAVLLEDVYGFIERCDPESRPPDIGV